LAEAAKGGAGQFAQSKGLEPRREQAKRDNAALSCAVTGTPGEAYWRKALGPQLPGDIRRVRPAALAPKRAAL